jgi:hypothetical protein
MDSVDVTSLLWLAILAALALSFGAGFLVGRASRRADDEPGVDRPYGIDAVNRIGLPTPAQMVAHDCEASIPVRGSDWESELDWERRQGQAQLRIGPPTREATAGILIIPDELSFPLGSLDGLGIQFPVVQHEDGCGVEHDLSRWECVNRPGGGDPGRA